MKADKNSMEPVCSGASPEQVAADLKPLVELQEEGLPLAELNRLVETRLLPHLMRYDRPSFQSMFNSVPEEGAELGAQIALKTNQGVTNWQVSPGGAVLEELCSQALCRLFGLAPGSEATFMYCGTYANHQALYLALHRRAEQEGLDLAQEGLAGFREPSRLAVVASEDAHFSLRHAVRVLGLGERSLIAVGVAANRRMDAVQLKKTLRELRTAGRHVFCVVATAGTTSTGAVDPIEEVAELSEEAAVWCHVDAAYGLAYKLAPEWTHLFKGVERADSLTWDPHKQFGVPIPSSLLFLRRSRDFHRMALHASYFNRPGTREPNPGVKSMPSTRPMTALALVTAIRHQGLAGIRRRLRAPLQAIRAAAEYLKQQPDMELCHWPDTGVLCFRAIPEGAPAPELNRLQRVVFERILAEGRRSISITRLGEQTALRLVAVSPEVTVEALKETIADVRRCAKETGSN